MFRLWSCARLPLLWEKYQGGRDSSFVTSNLQGGGNKLFAKTLYAGDVFVFPQGLIHFQFNVGNKPAVSIAALSNQNPGAVTIANAVFGSKPPISADVLTKAFQLNKDTVTYLQSSFGM